MKSLRSMSILPLLLAFGCASGADPAPSLRVTEVTLLGDLECFRVETPSATYFYGKKGAGFASILDPDGRDWISYRHGGKAAGEYRGLPKCGQPMKFFHAGYGFGQYATENPFTSRVVLQEHDHLQIASESKDGRSACTWDFYPSCATLTLLRIALPRFWFLYEGTPGGDLSPEEDVAIRPGGHRTKLAEPWEDTIPWVGFSSKRSPFTLVLVCHEGHAQEASYVAWPYQTEADGSYRQMTVFGWGRRGWKDPKQHEPVLSTLPARFSLALVRGTDDDTLLHAAQETANPR